MPFGFKKAVDDERISFGGGSAGTARRFAIDHSAAGIDRGVDAVEQDHFAAIRNPTRIDRAMSNPQSHASGTLVPPRIRIRTAPAAGPVESPDRVCIAVLRACRRVVTTEAGAVAVIGQIATWL